ncbi:MAG: hypothetical protein AAGF06_06250 [Pseudomonadota bacterium]
MKCKSLSTKLRLLLSASMLVLSQQALSAPNDTITNQATVAYTVNTNAQTAINSSPTGNNVPGSTEGATTDIKEDQLINFAVHTNDTENQVALPGSGANATTHTTNFTVYNIGSNNASDVALSASNTTNFSNGKITVSLAAVDIAGAPSPHPTSGDVFATSNCVVYDSTDNAITELELNPGESKAVKVSCDIPAVQLNGDVSGAVELRATVIKDYSNNDITGVDNTTANTIAGVEHVFLDDGKHGDDNDNKISIDYSAFIIEAPVLTVTKTVAVISDPSGSASASAKAVPGSILEYTIVVGNSETPVANGVTVIDALTPNLACNSVPSLVHSAGTTLTTPSCAQTVVGTCGNLGKDETCTLTVRAEILNN